MTCHNSNFITQLNIMNVYGFDFSIRFRICSTVNSCNKALGQESKFLVLVPPQKKNFRIRANLIFYENLKIRSLDPGFKIEFLLKMALFNLINIPGYMTRNILIFWKKINIFRFLSYFIKVFSNQKACIPILTIVILNKKTSLRPPVLEAGHIDKKRKLFLKA